MTTKPIHQFHGRALHQQRRFDEIHGADLNALQEDDEPEPEPAEEYDDIDLHIRENSDDSWWAETYEWRYEDQ